MTRPAILAIFGGVVVFAAIILNVLLGNIEEEKLSVQQTPPKNAGQLPSLEEEKLSVRKTETLVKRYNHSTADKSIVKQIIKSDPNIAQVEKELSNYLKAKVILKTNKSDKGSISIKFDDIQHLNKILDKIFINSEY